MCDLNAVLSMFRDRLCFAGFRLFLVRGILRFAMAAGFVCVMFAVATGFVFMVSGRFGPLARDINATAILNRNIFLGHFVRIVVVVAVVVIFGMLLFCFSFVALRELVTIAVAFLPIRAGCIAFFTTCRFP